MSSRGADDDRSLRARRRRSGGSVCALRGVLAVATATAALLAPRCAEAFAAAPRFLIASSPATSTIAYIQLPGDRVGPRPGEAMRVLVSKGLTFPQGIAVDAYRHFLYVADPSLGKLVRYKLRPSNDALSVGKQQDVASPVEVRAVAVDGMGNVWFTDEANQRVLRVSAKQLEEGHRTPQVVYDGSVVPEVRSPGGLAVDNFFVYWLNKAQGKTAGSLVKAKQNPSAALASFNASATTQSGTVHPLASNAEKCYGTCIALGNMFYTDEFNKLYGVPRTAIARGEVVTVSDSFKEPRGCTYDGDSTVYVADKAANAIYMFAANMEQLRPDRPVGLAAELQGAFGVAVYTLLNT
eukprot:CAMPEP_0176051264 /NCGR_PEP_ID=MMETSP0120_2-20121206/25486_1 /TAXON_ID=160619 /ORGANISM="Kryptoperidinium foliaceum, Strain CCMP 1326" /LENGTH=351 /DNA_ID=CAMNT_0017384705 /DNA_START=1 /DNA_END=1056 /DNA_ORIENTATION=+